ncbi:hypothetical protein KJ664_02845, partial [Patescibacteria group bacterium]|nr:hypothetical protein [Patescibacteria group bacterium]
LLWIILGLILSLPMSYLLGHHKEHLKDKRILKCLWRSCLRRSLLLSFLLFSYLLLGYLNAFNPQRYFIIFIACLIFEIWRSLR